MSFKIFYISYSLDPTTNSETNEHDFLMNFWTNRFFWWNTYINKNEQNYSWKFEFVVSELVVASSEQDLKNWHHFDEIRNSGVYGISNWEMLIIFLSNWWKTLQNVGVTVVIT